MISNEVSFRESFLSDVQKLSQTLREKDRWEAEKLGMPAHKALYHTFRQGILRKTFFVGNDMAAMSGVAGSPVGIVGRPYLVTSYAVQNISPIRFARIYKREVESYLKVFPVLENFVDGNYSESVRMLEIAGFNLTPITLNDNKFFRFSMTRESF